MTDWRRGWPFLMLMVLLLFAACAVPYGGEPASDVEQAVTATYSLGSATHKVQAGAAVGALAWGLVMPRLPWQPSPTSAFSGSFAIGASNGDSRSSVVFKVTRDPGGTFFGMFYPGTTYTVELLAGSPSPVYGAYGYLRATVNPGDYVVWYMNQVPSWLQSESAAPYIRLYLPNSTITAPWTPTAGAPAANQVFDTAFTFKVDTNYGCIHDLPPIDDDVTFTGSVGFGAWYYESADGFVYPASGPPAIAGPVNGCNVQTGYGGSNGDVVEWHVP